MAIELEIGKPRGVAVQTGERTSRRRTLTPRRLDRFLEGGAWQGPTIEAWTTRILRGIPAPRP
jgi:hypothetical protein